MPFLRHLVLQPPSPTDAVRQFALRALDVAAGLGVRRVLHGGVVSSDRVTRRMLYRASQDGRLRADAPAGVWLRSAFAAPRGSGAYAAGVGPETRGWLLSLLAATPPASAADALALVTAVDRSVLPASTADRLVEAIAAQAPLDVPLALRLLQRQWRGRAESAGSGEPAAWRRILATSALRRAPEVAPLLGARFGSAAGAALAAAVDALPTGDELVLAWIDLLHRDPAAGRALFARRRAALRLTAAQLAEAGEGPNPEARLFVQTVRAELVGECAVRAGLRRPLFSLPGDLGRARRGRR